MTNTQSQKTPEELRAEIVKNARKTLEHKVFRDVVGGNHMRNNPMLYGQLGSGGAETAYGNAMNSI